MSENRTVWDMQDDYDATSDPQAQEAIKQEMRDNGYSGVANTIGRD